MERRKRVLGRHVTPFYDTPFAPVRGEGVWLFDAEGNRYLDCYNNVPHVGHCHPKVVNAIARQAATLNIHTRYVHDGVVEYGERLTAKLNHDISTMIMVNSGSEAN
ncbi:aminotransferase, partial [Marinosulfonomonas sp. PRT-SC04]